ncbi:MAG TPA: VWA domain-containing protein [Vicinamibacterales bacterium]|nr:VWA domain-containing protein [Vicinamibacterales bacterium]
MTDPPGHFVENLVVFGRVLRRLGFEIPVGRILELTEALTYVDLNVRDEVFHTCRALLVQRHEQLARFEDAFDAFWRDHSNPFAMQGTNVGDARTSVARASMSSGLLTPEGGATDEGTGDEAREGVVQTWSEIGGLAHKDFAEFSPEEMARARLALDRLEWIPGERRTRRWVRGRGPRIDLRRALMRSLRSGGEVVVLPTRRRRTKPRPLVLLCDVSGSMERYSRMLLHFAHGLAHRHGRLEVFLFATGLTRVTRQIRVRRLQQAVDAVSDVVPDWSGGTRIGPALRQFHQRWARRVLHQAPVVLLISDGWDRGDPAVLREEVARLQRSCHRLIWLNPLIGTFDYAPLTRGLQAALPFVDDFLAARTLADLADLAVHLGAVASHATSRRRRTRI